MTKVHKETGAYPNPWTKAEEKNQLGNRWGKKSLLPEMQDEMKAPEPAIVSKKVNRAVKQKSPPAMKRPGTKTEPQKEEGKCPLRRKSK